MLGGHITVASQINQGSTFTFSIKNFKNTLIKNFSDDANEQAINFDQKHILVAEDNEVNQVVVGNQLKKLRVQFKVVNDGTQAIHAIKRDSYDLILMDCQMPNLDGFEATRQIRVFNPEIPIIGFTASAMDNEYKKCIEAGMNNILSKPVRKKDLEKAFAKAFDSKLKKSA